MLFRNSFLLIWILFFVEKMFVSSNKKMFILPVYVSIIVVGIYTKFIQHVYLYSSNHLCHIQELHNHVEEGLGRNLQQRCSFVLQQAVETTQREMTGILRLSKL